MNEQLCCGSVEMLERWYEHFQSVSSVFSESTIYLMSVLPLRSSRNGLLSKLLKCCDVDLLEYIRDLFVAVWEEEDITKE